MARGYPHGPDRGTALVAGAWGVPLGPQARGAVLSRLRAAVARAWTRAARGRAATAHVLGHRQFGSSLCRYEIFEAFHRLTHGGVAAMLGISRAGSRAVMRRCAEATAWRRTPIREVRRSHRDERTEGE
jgi:hypothetical protein